MWGPWMSIPKRDYDWGKGVPKQTRKKGESVCVS